MDKKVLPINSEAERERERERVKISPRNFNLYFLKTAAILFCVGFLFLGFTIPKAFAINAPSDVSGLQLWLDTSQANSLYKDAAKTQPATTESDKVAVWADLSGNGYDATQSNAANQPLLTLNKDGGYAGVKFGASVNVGLTLGNPANLNFGNAASETYFFVYNQTSAPEGYALIMEKGGTSSNSRALWFVKPADNYAVRRYNGSSSPSNANFPGDNIYSYSFTSTSSTAGVDVDYMNGNGNRTSVTALDTWPTASNWNIGGNGSFRLVGYMQAVLVYNRALSGAEIDSVNQYLANKFNLVSVSATSHLVYDGNSITIGNVGGDGSIPFEQVAYISQSNKIPYVSLGISGIPTPTLTSGASAKVDPYYNSNLTNNILVGWEGTNDIRANNANGTTAYNNLVTYYNARKTIGWKNIAVTILPRSIAQGPDPQETSRLAANALLRTNYASFSEALVDVGNDPNIGQTGQAEATTYYLDGVHPNNAGHAVIGGYVQKAIDALVNPLTSLTSVSASPASTSATVGWTSNVSASSIVNFGLTSSYSNSTTEANNTAGTRSTSHSVAVSGLAACALYHYNTSSNQLSAVNDLVYLKNNTVSSSDSAFLTTGCTGNATVSSSTSITITTASGGSLSLDTLSFTVPTSFTGLASSANFQIKNLDPTAFTASAGAPTSKLLAGNKIFNLKALTDVSTTLSTFSQPITVTMSYVPSDISGIVESSLKIYRYDGSSWTMLDSCSVDTGAETVTCQTSNFSDFGMFGEALSTDATLSNLAISSGTLSPSFASGTTSYTASVSNATTSVTVTPTVNQANATVKVNTITVASASPSGSISLNVGANTITTVVTAQDGTTTDTYTITVTRAASTDTTGTPVGGGGGGVSYYTIIASAGANGSIAPLGLISLAYRGSQTYAITPATGFKVADVLVDNVHQGAITTYTFSNVNNGHIITATFSAIVTPAQSAQNTMTLQQKIALIAQIKQQLILLITQLIQILTLQLSQMQ